MSKFYLLLATKPRFADAPAAPASPAAAPAAAPSSAPSTPSTPSATPSTPAAAPSSTAPAAPTGQQPAGGGFNFREELRGLGIQGDFADDKAAFGAFAEHARQLQAQQQFAQIGQQLYPKLSEFQKWEKQQQDAAAAEAAKNKKSWWSPPEWNDQWMDAIDAEGHVKPGYDPTIPSKIEAARKFQREMWQKFSQNPIELLKPGLEELIAEKAQAMIQQQLGGYQNQQTNESFIQQNSGWLYEQQPNNAGVKVDASGKKILTVAGQLMVKYCGELERAGVTDVNTIRDWAIERTRATLLQIHQQTAPAASAAPASAAPAAPAAAPPAGVNRLQGLDPNGNGRQDSIPRPARLPLRQRMSANLDRAGIQKIGSN
jgi:hypothetical protein